MNYPSWQWFWAREKPRVSQADKKTLLAVNLATQKHKCARSQAVRFYMSRTAISTCQSIIGSAVKTTFSDCVLYFEKPVDTEEGLVAWYNLGVR